MKKFLLKLKYLFFSIFYIWLYDTNKPAKFIRNIFKVIRFIHPSDHIRMIANNCHDETLRMALSEVMFEILHKIFPGGK